MDWYQILHYTGNYFLQTITKYTRVINKYILKNRDPKELGRNTENTKNRSKHNRREISFITCYKKIKRKGT